ncbi:hypothetical protein [Marinobacterium aestuarii]|uniref:hypothetical protein n=1 Tax=Marinobacterium aestuarii TaxID=1821621 RepID=UPI000B07B365|nr:hypothetical protein [Marinobacterium aestuarii]
MKNILVFFIAMLVTHFAYSANLEQIDVGVGETLTINNQTVYANISVNGGTLFLKNQAYVEGSIDVKENGVLDSQTGSIVGGNVEASGAFLVKLNNTNVNGKVKLSDTKSFISGNNSVLFSNLWLMNCENVDVSNSLVESGEIRVTKAQVANIFANRTKKLILTENKYAFAVMNTVYQNIKVTDNDIAFMDSNTAGAEATDVDPKNPAEVKIVDNIATHLFQNSFYGKVKVLPSDDAAAICEMDGNVFNHLIFGCGDL